MIDANYRTHQHQNLKFPGTRYAALPLFNLSSIIKSSLRGLEGDMRVGKGFAMTLLILKLCRAQVFKYIKPENFSSTRLDPKKASPLQQTGFFLNLKPLTSSIPLLLLYHLMHCP